VLLALVCAGVALALALRAALTTSDNWLGLAGASVAMFVAAIVAVVTSRRSIALMASNGQGLAAFRRGSFAEAEEHFRQSWEMAQAFVR